MKVIKRGKYTIETNIERVEMSDGKDRYEAAVCCGDLNMNETVDNRRTYETAQTWINGKINAAIRNNK